MTQTTERGSLLFRIVRIVLSAALWLALSVSAVKVTHDFYRYIDRSIHVTVDDAEANISYALATEGRYGFFSSPVLVGMDRTHTQFNYGPWYFYMAAGLTWVFGFSLTLMRSIHLAVILGTVVVAGFSFGGRHRAAVTALFGFSLLYCFDASQWPMVRPDSMVSAFAVPFLAFAGLAWMTGRPWHWFAAGLTATCGAFTHLIAASLVPSVLLLFVLSAWFTSDKTTGLRWSWRKSGPAALALGAGILLGLVMFYAAIGFDFVTQRRFFSAYRDVTASQASFTEVFSNHLRVAFSYLSYEARWLVAFVYFGGMLSLLASLWFDAARQRVIQARLFPPLVVWSAYAVSNGFYSNFHQGYAILHQVLFFWTAAAGLWVILELADRYRAALGTAIGTLAMVALLFAANQQLHWQFSDTNWKILRIATWAPYSEYVERVLQPIPARAKAWGSIVFGMEAPGRIQLVQWADAVTVVSNVGAVEGEALTPDFVIFGYAEARDNVLSMFRGGETLLYETERRLPGIHLRLVSLVAAAPYGVTRTYARQIGGVGAPRSSPVVNVYDPRQRQWLTRVGAPMPVTFNPVTPMTLRIGYEVEPRANTPHNAVMAELPAGRYLLKVAVTPGSGPTHRRMLAATSATMLKQTIGEMGPDGDFAAYLDRDTEISLLIVHPGGPLYVNQFDDGVAPRIDGVTISPIIGLVDPDEQPTPELKLPPLSKWSAIAGVSAHPDGEIMAIDGDTSQGGYQFLSPPIRVRQGNRVTVRVPTRVERGNVCSGILNGDESGWIVPPLASREDIQFVMDSTQGFRVVLANCKAQQDTQATRFLVWPGSYLLEEIDGFYTDRLVLAALYPGRAKPEELADLSVRTFPSNLRVTKAEVEGPVKELAEADFSYRAGLVRKEGSTWVASGTAEGKYSYLLQSKDQRLTKDSRVLVSGRVERGGLSIGLLKDSQWVGQINLTEPGDFTVVLAPPAAGNYSVLVANNIRDGLETSVVLSHIGRSGTQ